jgi:hypothetical protein
MLNIQLWGRFVKRVPILGHSHLHILQAHQFNYRLIICSTLQIKPRFYPTILFFCKIYFSNITRRLSFFACSDDAPSTITTSASDYWSEASPTAADNVWGSSLPSEVSLVAGATLGCSVLIIGWGWLVSCPPLDSSKLPSKASRACVRGKYCSDGVEDGGKHSSSGMGGDAIYKKSVDSQSCPCAAAWGGSACCCSGPCGPKTSRGGGKETTGCVAFGCRAWLAG